MKAKKKMDKAKGIRKRRRECAICGKRIYVTVYEDGHYRNGHFFGKLELPVEGTGEYKKIGTSKLLGLKADVVEWTGKEKKVEYWECNSCYEEGVHDAWLEEKIEELYGERCLDYEAGCPCCQAWSLYDIIIDSNREK